LFQSVPDTMVEDAREGSWGCCFVMLVLLG
jgi:hypothetical protein